MSKVDDSSKRIEQAEYRAKIVEAELNAVKSSKAYKLSKKLGIIYAQVKSDPVGLSKKAAKMLFTDPKKASHMFRSASRGAYILQSVADQTAKYQEWILLNEPDEAELDAQREAAEQFEHKPLISILTPVFNPPVGVLEELIESVLEQTYPNFELCLGDFGGDAEVESLIARYANLDPRIKHYRFNENKGIGGNSNQILEKVEGDFIALLDHDDTLSPDALYENVRLINQKPYDFIYSDKDKIDEKNNRFDPLFKPQISPEMLLNINYLTHLNIMRTSIVRKIGGWDPVTDGAQDWDLFLRVVAEAKHIGHIPKVLYHWRVIATSTAMSIETKPYALANQCKAVDKYLKLRSIPAHAYIQKTELFLKWDPGVLDEHPVVFIFFSSIANTLRITRRVKRAVKDPNIVVLVHEKNKSHTKINFDHVDAEIVVYKSGALGKSISKFVRESSSDDSKNALFLLDTIQLPLKPDWYANLTGWLSIDGVGAAGGRLVNRQDLIVSSGGVITPDLLYFPLFKRYPRYYQSYLGNAEWVRNVSIISPIFCATNLETLRSFDFTDYASDEEAFDAYFLNVSKHGRIVVSPHSTASIRDDIDLDVTRPLPMQKQAGKEFIDPFSNPNMSRHDALRLFEEEALPGMPDPNEHEPVDRYQYDATILADTFDVTVDEITKNKQALAQNEGAPAHSVAWFLPSFDGVYAGLMNIFSFANYLVEKRGLQTTLYILKSGTDVTNERAAVLAAFPSLKAASFVAIAPTDTAKIKQHDIGIATQWATAFPLAKAAIKQKYYFIQDNEANFYPKGSISALVELTYQFGFKAIAGTDGLLDIYKKQYGGDGYVLKSKVDLSSYHPRENVHYVPKKPYKVFFYARPNMPRNAFELGVAGLKKLKQELGSDVEIITAGASWDSKAYGVEGLFTNLGKIAYDAVPKLYRSVDAGLMFMFSGHPGVTASELMASGCPVVVNEYDDVTWHELYQHEKTCLITQATASEVARNLKRCLTEPALRKTLIANGLSKSASFYSGYETSLQTVADAIKAKAN